MIINFCCSLQQTSLGDHLSKMDKVESSAKQEYKARLEQSQADNTQVRHTHIGHYSCWRLVFEKSIPRFEEKNVVLSRFYNLLLEFFKSVTMNFLFYRFIKILNSSINCVLNFDLKMTKILNDFFVEKHIFVQNTTTIQVKIIL